MSFFKKILIVLHFCTLFVLLVNRKKILRIINNFDFNFSDIYVQTNNASSIIEYVTKKKLTNPSKYKK